VGTNFVLVEDKGSLERDVAAKNGWTHGQDRD